MLSNWYIRQQSCVLFRSGTLSRNSITNLKPKLKPLRQGIPLVHLKIKSRVATGARILPCCLRAASGCRTLPRPQAPPSFSSASCHVTCMRMRRRVLGVRPVASHCAWLPSLEGVLVAASSQPTPAARGQPPSSPLPRRPALARLVPELTVRYLCWYVWWIL